MSDNPNQGSEPLGSRKAAGLISLLSDDGLSLREEQAEQAQESEPAQAEEQESAELETDAEEAEEESEAEPAEAVEEGEGEELEELEEGEEQEPDREPVYTVTVDGQTSEVTLTELRNGYQRQSDYTRKSQQLAEQRKGFEQEQQAIGEIRDRYTQNLEVVENFLTNSAPYTREELNRIAREEPHRFAVAKDQVDQHREQLAAVKAELENSRKEQRWEQEQAHRTMVANAQQRLPEVIPEWRDQKVAAEQSVQLTEYLRNEGVPDAEIQSIVSPLAISLARKAMLYDQSQKAAKTVTEKKVVKKAPTKVAKPGAAKQPGHQKAKRSNDLRNRLKKGGGSREERTHIAAQLIGNLK